MKGDTGNLLLDELPPSARRTLLRSCGPVSVGAGEQLVTQGGRITHAFFPTTAVCSLVVELASGDKAETCTVGREGFVGVPLVLGVSASQTSGLVQVAGEGYRIQGRKLTELSREHDAFRAALLGYSAFRLHVASRSVACNSFHSVVQRTAKWLLMAHDRAGRDEFLLTHEFLSTMIAATRPRVSQAAARLRAEGIIGYRRGTVRILERRRLEAVSCECYEETKRIFPTARQ